MEVQFTPDQQAFVRQAIDSGRLRREGRTITTPEEVTQLSADIRRRGLARLAAEQNPR